jgi:hypothetical protein
LSQGGNNKRMKSELLPTVLASPVDTFFAAILLSVTLVGARASRRSRTCSVWVIMNSRCRVCS